MSAYFEIRERRGDLSLASRHLDLLLEPSDRDLDLALLESELCKCGNGRLARRIQYKRLAAKCFCCWEILTPLKYCEGLINKGQWIGRGASDFGSVLQQERIARKTDLAFSSSIAVSNFSTAS